MSRLSQKNGYGMNIAPPKHLRQDVAYERLLRLPFYNHIIAESQIAVAAFRCELRQVLAAGTSTQYVLLP